MEKYNYEGEKFLLSLYNDMHIKQSVIHSSNISDKKLEKIKKYLDRNEVIHYNAREKNKIDLLKRAYYDKYVIKEIPQSYINFLDKQNFDQTGYHLSVNQINNKRNIIIENQKRSLSIWIDYLTSDDSKFYPWWTKYWAFMGMLKIGAYDDKNGIYGTRSINTVAPFIELDQESLSKAISIILKQVYDDELDVSNVSSFTKLYTVLLKNKKNYVYNNCIDGIWKKYDQGNNYKELFDSLQGYNTSWCTAGEATCKQQLKNGDFYVYYTKNDNDEYKVPRLAIRMDGKNVIGEIRGVAKGQNVEPLLEDVLNKKLQEFPDKDKYIKRVNDSKMLTYIYTKYKLNKELTKDDLRFIYEIDKKIEGFGYEVDPRVEEIRNNIDLVSSLSIIFDCNKEQVLMTSDDGMSVLEYMQFSKECKGIKCIIGNLLLLDSELPVDFKFPDNIFRLRGTELLNGDLRLPNIKSIENLVFPKRVRNLDLYSLESAKDVVFPEVITQNLFLQNIKEINNITFPHEVDSLYLNRLESAKDIIFPEVVDGVLNLESLKYAENITFPKDVLSLFLNKLESSDGLVLPKVVRSFLNLESLKTSKNITFPKKVWWLFLDGLRSTDDLVLPSEINTLFCSGYIKKSDLDLSDTFVNEIIFPNEVFGTIDNIKSKSIHI